MIVLCTYVGTCK